MQRFYSMNLFISYYTYQDNNAKLRALDMTFNTFLEGNVISEDSKESFISCIIDICKNANSLYPSTKKIEAEYDKIENCINIFHRAHNKKIYMFIIILAHVDMILLKDENIKELSKLFKKETQQ
jgi:hypothetical protein